MKPFPNNLFGFSDKKKSKATAAAQRDERPRVFDYTPYASQNSADTMVFGNGISMPAAGLFNNESSNDQDVSEISGPGKMVKRQSILERESRMITLHSREELAEITKKMDGGVKFDFTPGSLDSNPNKNIKRSFEQRSQGSMEWEAEMEKHRRNPLRGFSHSNSLVAHEEERNDHLPTDSGTIPRNKNFPFLLPPNKDISEVDKPFSMNKAEELHDVSDTNRATKPFTTSSFFGDKSNGQINEPQFGPFNSKPGSKDFPIPITSQKNTSTQGKPFNMNNPQGFQNFADMRQDFKPKTPLPDEKVKSKKAKIEMPRKEHDPHFNIDDGGEALMNEIDTIMDKYDQVYDDTFEQQNDEGRRSLLIELDQKLNESYASCKTIRDDIAKKEEEALKKQKDELSGTPDNQRTTRSLHPTAELYKKLHTKVFALKEIYRRFEYSFPNHSGGFGAVGRAHEMKEIEIEDVDKTTGQIKGDFFKGLTLSPEPFAQSVIKKQAKPNKELKAGDPLINDVNIGKYDDNKKKDLVPKWETNTKAVKEPGKVDFNGPPVGKPRGEGQKLSMYNSNATGYACLNNIGGWENQRWEWLHIRAAGLGGGTDSSNLVVGTRDANTHMIPFESNIRTLGNIVKDNKQLYKQLSVVWSLSPPIAKHMYDKIKIKWDLVPAKQDKNAPPLSGTVEFNPLDTTVNISKQEAKALEKALEKNRNLVNPQTEQTKSEEHKKTSRRQDKVEF